MNITNMEWPLSKKELKYLYFDKDLTQKEIGNKFNRDVATVNYHYKKHNISCYSEGYRQRKTNEEFKNEVYNLIENEYTFLEKYKTNNHKLKVKHNKCNNIYKVTPNSFLSAGRRCPHCSASTPKTTKQFQKELNNKFNNEFKVLGKYKRANKKIKIRHKKCGYKWYVTPDSILQTVYGCPKCANKNPWNKKTHKEFVKKIKENGEKYEILGKYINSKTKILVKHNKCGGIYKALPYNLLSREINCPVCAGKRISKKQRKTNKEFLKELRNKWGNKYFEEYKILEEYKENAKTKIKIRHNKCGNIYKVEPQSLLNGHGCRKCSYKIIKEKEMFSQTEAEKFVKEKMGKQYKLISKYKGTHNKVKIKHLKCGKVSEYNFTSLYSNTICKYCFNNIFSKPMQKIEKTLEKNNINFHKEKMFDELIYKNNLRFDFFIKENNIAIEYNGKQHYKPIKYFGGEKSLIIRQKRDRIKKQYCKENNIKLIEIPYWEKDNIEEILLKKLKEE